MRRLRLLAVAIVLTALAAVGVATDQPVRPPTTAVQTEPVTTTVQVCPQLTGNGTGTSTRLTVADPSPAARATTVTVSTFGPHPGRRRIDVTPYYAETVDRRIGPVAVTATGPGAATVAAAQVGLRSHGAGRGLTAVRCERPAADWWFVGADGRVGYQDLLQLANPGVATATVSVTLSSSAPHPVTAPTLESVGVPAHGTVSVPIPHAAPDAPNLALHVHASNGLVAAALLDARIHGVDPRGSDWIPATSPGTRVVVPGLIAGPGQRWLTIANPSRQAVSVTLTLVTERGEFIPNGLQRINVPGGQTAPVDLTHALAGQAGAVVLTAAHPIFAAASASTTAPRSLPDLLWRAGTPPLRPGDTWAQGWTGSGRDDLLALCAPGRGATVRLRDPLGAVTSVRVPSRRTVVVSLSRLLHAPASGPRSVTVTAVAGGAVYGVQTVHEAGAHGPLVTGLVATAPAPPTRLPALRYDPSVAIRP